MEQTFGEKLYQFSRTIDIVKRETFNEITSLTEKYLDSVLDIKHIRIMINAVLHDKQVWLCKHSLDTLPSDNSFFPVLNDQGEYNGQMSLAYSQGSHLWIVNDSEPHNLLENNSYVDLWSNVKSNKINKYIPINNKYLIKTSIIVPIENDDGKTRGVINYESSKYLEITEKAKKELLIISKSISILYTLSKFNRSTRSNTENVLKFLRDSLRKSNVNELTKPKIFIASASHSDPEVVKVINTELDKFSDKFIIAFWGDEHGSGDINNKILETVTQCQYGVCYLSEFSKDENSEHRFNDNPNVIYEAGMLNASSSIGSVNKSWFAIREEDSPDVPFDMASDRMITVPRLKNGDLNEQAFTSEFKKKIQALIEADLTL